MLSGEGRRSVLIVSEKDWHNEHWMLDRLIQRSASLDRSHFYFATLSTPDLLQQINSKNIKVIYALGDRVLQRLTGERDILRWRGRAVEWHGRWLVPGIAPHDLLPKKLSDEEKFKLKALGIMPLTSPPRFQGTWMLDAQFAVHISQNGFTRKQASYTVDPTPAEFRDYVRDGYLPALRENPELLLSYDIETPWKVDEQDEDELEEKKIDPNATILRISFAFEERTGVSVPFVGPYFETIRRLLGSSGKKVGWNDRIFDRPILRSAGFPINGELHDGMDAWHFFQSDLPRGLEYVTSYTSDLLPWKHLNNSDPGLYSAIDPDAALRNHLYVMNAIQRLGMFSTYMNHYVRLMPAMDVAGKRGNFIDLAKRDALRDEMERILAEKTAEIQPLVPREVKPRKVWLTPPVERWPKLSLRQELVGTIAAVDGDRDFDVVEVAEPVKTCSACNQIATNKSDHFKGSKEPKLDLFGEQLVDKKTGKPKFTQLKNPCKVMGGEIVERPGIRFEYHEVLPFNPNSSDQLKVYARFHGHPIGQDKKDASKEAMDANHLKQLKKRYKKHETFYDAVLTVKKLKKTLGTYIYEPDAEGLIHTTYKNGPTTPRFSSANVNLQNLGKKEENQWALRAREQLIARPGHRFVQADSSAIEAVIQGWFMNDPVYMELATQSVHAWVVAKHLGIDWTGTVEQVEFLKKAHKALYNKMKVTNYLTNFGGGAFLLWKTFPEEFPTKQSAEEAQAMLYNMLPKLKQFHNWVRETAKKQGYLELPGWRHRHYFYSVYAIDPRTGHMKQGKDAKRALAYFPQGSAAAFMRDNMLLLAYGDQAAEWLGIEPLGLGDGYLDWLPANVVIHDGYTLEVPDGKEEQAAEALEKILTRPIPQLSNLRVGAEIDIGPVGGNWGSYDAVQNPQGLKTVKVVRPPMVMPPGITAEAA